MGDNYLILEREIYYYIAARQVKISLNGTDWANLSDSKAMLSILGLEGGSFSLGLRITREEGVVLAIKLVTQ